MFTLHLQHIAAASKPFPVAKQVSSRRAIFLAGMLPAMCRAASQRHTLSWSSGPLRISDESLPLLPCCVHAANQANMPDGAHQKRS